MPSCSWLPRRARTVIEQILAPRTNNPTCRQHFKEEHYRRISYTNEQFRLGIPGGKTTLAACTSMWGRRMRSESHPTGAPTIARWKRVAAQPALIPGTWRWRYLEGIGENIILEFAILRDPASIT